MIHIPDVPETLHSQRERRRLHAQGRRSDDNTGHTLLIINEADVSWSIHGLGAPRVRLTRDVMMPLAAQILVHAR